MYSSVHASSKNHGYAGGRVNVGASEKCRRRVVDYGIQSDIEGIVEVRIRILDHG